MTITHASKIYLKILFFLLIAGFLNIQCSSDHSTKLIPQKRANIVLIGNNLGSRMMNYGYFETELQLRYPDSLLIIRNMCDGGNTPGFRPHSGRVSPWAFPGAEKFQTENAKNSGSKGHFETPDQWLTRLKADVIIAFFGYNESFDGPEGLDNYKAELSAFVEHSLNQNYNGHEAPQLALVSPIAFEDLSYKKDLPDGKQENEHLAMYTKVMEEVAHTYGIHFVDLFHKTRNRFSSNRTDWTIDGAQLTAESYEILAPELVDELFGEDKILIEEYRDLVHEAVKEKNWMWHNDFKIPNGVHVFGRRYNPFGPENYPDELAKIREMTNIRDQAIWGALKGQVMDVRMADQSTHELQPVKTNYRPSEKNGNPEYLYGEEAEAKLKVPEGYKIELFASEKEFPDLANPVQLSFDNKGRLWVAVMPEYPHYRPGDDKPDDKLLILEDTDGDNRADKQTIFASGLHLPVGFEFAPEGVYVSQGTNLVLLRDEDGDDHADSKEIIMSGFDDHDTHHVISAFCADPSGAIYMGEGVFLHTNVETPYGPIRGTNGGFWRYAPQRHQLERTAQVAIPNPWGIAFDEWGQNFFAETSGPNVRWMMPGSIKPRYGVATHKSFNLIEKEHMVRPTSGLEFLHSRHFPEEVQGDMLINNNIGFLGTKQHQMIDEGTGYRTKHRQDLVVGEDPNFRPVDMEIAPDGSLYIVDWHNVLIGHMQHNARDPLRDHVHGRIYRLTYPSRPLVDPPQVYGASIETLLKNLELPEYRARYRSRRELRGRDKEEVLSKMSVWIEGLDPNLARYEHHLLEGLWVSWGLNKIDQKLLRKLLNAKDYRVRTAAVKVLRYTGHQVKDQSDLLLHAASDEHGRVRLEALVAASWLPSEKGLPAVEVAGLKPMDEWIVNAQATALAHLNGKSIEEKKEEDIQTRLKGKEKALLVKGKEIYSREGYCMTCHQVDGRGLGASGFPPLQGSRWVLESEDRLIKIILKGLMGPITVRGKTYPGQVPMTPYEALLNDEEIAAVATYVRNSFGNRASVITPEKVKSVRAEVEDKEGFYDPEDLLKEHPHGSK